MDSLCSLSPTHQSTPLHRAAGGGHGDIVKFLVGKEANIHSEDMLGVSEQECTIPECV